MCCRALMVCEQTITNTTLLYLILEILHLSLNATESHRPTQNLLLLAV